MADESQGGERTEEATPRKKERARKEGQVAKSQEVSIAVTMLLLAGLLTWVFPAVARDAVAMFRHGLSLEGDEIMIFRANSVVRMREGARAIFDLVSPVAFPALLLGVAANVAQVGFQINMEVFALKWDRLDPVAGLKRIFGVELPVQLIKSMFKGMGIVLIALLALRGEPTTLFRMAYLPVPMVADELGRVAYVVVVRVAAAMAVIAGLDLLWTRYRHEERLKMSKQEVKDEMKESEGDPQVKARRRAMAAALRKRSLEAAVKTATVVTVNPTHYAVALRYKPGVDSAPVVVAKGIDFKALRIRELAEKHEIPVKEDIPLTRALHAAVKEGDAIPLELYQAVANLLKVIRSIQQQVPKN